MSKILNWVKANVPSFSNVPHSRGVYVIACRCTDGSSIVVYTGQSSDLNRRLNEHWSSSESNNDLKKAISNYPWAFQAYFALIEDARCLDGCERRLFDYYNPQLTDRAPDVSPIDCSLPPNVIKGHVNFK